MTPYPIRLSPGSDLRRRLEEVLVEHGSLAGFVIAGIGSLSEAQLRFAGKEQPTVIVGDLEIVTLAGTLSPDGAHLHMSIADGDGVIRGGHLGYGCRIRTTAEILMLFLPDWSFTRRHDPNTGFAELEIHPAR